MLYMNRTAVTTILWSLLWQYKEIPKRGKFRFMFDLIDSVIDIID